MRIKLIPGIKRKKVDLTKFFHSVDCGMNIEDWREFDRSYEISCECAYLCVFDDIEGTRKLP